MSPPNLVAMITSERRDLTAWPSRVSEPPRFPYTSAVSNKVIPASIAAFTTSGTRSSGIRAPKLLQPIPTVETVRPDGPSWV